LQNAAWPQRPGKPEEFADFVMAVAANPMVNGETIRLDGGLRMPPL
jgi:NAD(P)-dependent dehydrogenase (short-subunit alcohol dehydrogenase family)